MRGTGGWCAAACAAGLVAGAGAPASTASAGPTIERVNETPQGGQSVGGAAWPGVSADGRRVMFASPAGDLIEGDMNNAWDVFVRDEGSGAVRRISESAAGVEGDGDSGHAAGVGTEAGRRAAAMSSDGRWVAFISSASNLIDGETDPDLTADVFLREVDTGVVVRLPGMTGAREVWISPTGSHVFALAESGLEWSRASGETSAVPGLTHRMRSRDGGMIADSYDNCVRVGPEGSTHYLLGPTCMAPTDAKLRLIDLSDDGMHVLTKINYLLAGTLFESCVYGPLPPPSVEAPCIAGEEGGEAGEVRAVMSPSGYLFAHVDIETGRAVRVFERDLSGGVWRSVETGFGGEPLDGPFGDVDLSDTGAVVCISAASNLIEGDTNGAADVFIVRGLVPITPASVELEILIDASSAVSAAGYSAMVEGVRAALQDPAVFPRTGDVAVRVGVFDDRVHGGLGWSMPVCPCDAPALGAQVDEAGAMARPAASAAACLKSVLEREAPIFELKRFTGGRRVVLVIGPGEESCFSAAELARARDRAMGWVDEIHAVVLDGGGPGFAMYRDAVAGPAGVGMAVAGAADYSDARERIAGALGAILNATGPHCPADVNRDGLVDFADYLAFLGLAESEDCRGDLNEDCIVDFGDMLEFLMDYDGGC